MVVPTLENIIYNEFLKNIVNSLFSFLVIVLSYCISLYYIKKKRDSERRKKQLRMRILYLCTIICFILMARIWVDGFTHLLAVLGLVSAALVITNKETIMNLVGWMIINWREIFTEGDLVQIKKNLGYIKSIGMLYITLTEVTEQPYYLKTGRLLKIPNGLVTSEPIINFNHDLKAHPQEIIVLLEVSEDLDFIEEEVVRILNKINDQICAEKQYSESKKKLLQGNYGLGCCLSVSFSLKQDKRLLIEAKICFSCFISDVEKMKTYFIKELLQLQGNDTKLKLAEKL